MALGIQEVRHELGDFFGGVFLEEVDVEATDGDLVAGLGLSFAVEANIGDELPVTRARCGRLGTWTLHVVAAWCGGRGRLRFG